MEDNKSADREILLFSMPEEVGALAKALKVFEVLHASIYYLISRVLKSAVKKQNKRNTK